MKQLSLARPAAYLRAHIFWVELFGVSFLALLAAGSIVVSARRQATLLRDEAARLDRIVQTSNQWVSTFQPPVAQESIAWRSTAREARQLGTRADDRLTLARSIANRAEEAGLSGVHMVFAAPDSLPVPPRVVGPFTFRVAQYSFIVDFNGGFAATSALLGNLPGAVRVRSIQLKRSGRSLGTSVTLDVYEPAGTNGNS